MVWFKNLKMSGKLFVGFGAVIILVVIMATIAFIGLMNIDARYQNIIRSAPIALRALDNVSGSFNRFRHLGTSAIIRTGDTNAINALKAQYDAEREIMRGHFDNFYAAVSSNVLLSPAEIEARHAPVREVQAMLDKEYHTYISSVFERALDNDFEGALYLVDSSTGMIDLLTQNLASTTTTVQNTRDNMIVSSHDLVQATIIKVSVSIIVTILIAAAIAMIISKIIKNDLHSLTEAAHSIAKGDFSIDVGSNGKDEISILSNSLLEIKNVAKNLSADIENSSYNFSIGNLTVDDLSHILIDESKYNGGYAKIAKGMNHSVRELIEECIYMIGSVSQIANGDFSIDIRSAPGGRVLMTQTFQSLKDNLIRFSDDIVTVIDGASDSNLNVKIDTTLYKGD